MSVETHLDELIDYTSLIISKLCNSKEVVALITDNPEPDLSGEDGALAERNIFDYDYIDDTVQSAGAFIMVDADMVLGPTGSIKDIEVYVQVVVSKTYMDLDSKKFKGVKGNRRDNLARQIDLLLRDSREFGIGKLHLNSARTANVPRSFTSKLLTYTIPDFSKNRKVY